jgi:hypothetical protein
VAKRKTQIESPKKVARAMATDESAQSQEQSVTPPATQAAPPTPKRADEMADVASATERLADSEEPAGAADRARMMKTAQRAVGNARVSRMTYQPVLQRQPRGSTSGRKSAPKVGTRFTHPSGSRSPHRSITGEFDGREFILRGDGAELMRVPAASGRPVSVRPKDASKCKGSTSESYLNNPRYVGIPDFGPIPEGEYQFQATEFATFTLAEQAQFTLGGQFTDPFGKPMHGGDWGAGRSPLNKIRVLPAPPGCGNTARRSGFFIHGGSLAGSSGCIDIGNAGVTGLLPHLTGYKNKIVVTVRYRHPAPAVGTLGRALGGFTYPGQEDPTLEDRLRGAGRELFGGGGEEER